MVYVKMCGIFFVCQGNVIYFIYGYLQYTSLTEGIVNKLFRLQNLKKKNPRT